MKVVLKIIGFAFLGQFAWLYYKGLRMVFEPYRRPGLHEPFIFLAAFALTVIVSIIFVYESKLKRAKQKPDSQKAIKPKPAIEESKAEPERLPIASESDIMLQIPRPGDPQYDAVEWVQPTTLTLQKVLANANTLEAGVKSISILRGDTIPHGYEYRLQSFWKSYQEMVKVSGAFPQIKTQLERCRSNLRRRQEALEYVQSIKPSMGGKVIQIQPHEVRAQAE